MALGAALLLSVAGCDSSAHESARVDVSQARLAKVATLPVAGDPLADLGDSLAGRSPRIVAEARVGSSRLVIYTGERACGFVAMADTGPAKSLIHLITKWPDKGEGEALYPAGPYNRTTGTGASKVWASVACSPNAMVIEYSAGPGAPLQVAGARGQMSITRMPGSPSTWTFVIGDPRARAEISAKLPTP